jgi:Flp pilus assembly protein TadG
MRVRKPARMGLNWPRTWGAVSENGTSLVEFAISVPILFMLLFGFMEVALGIYTLHTCSEAARDAARWAIVRGSSSCTNTPNLTDCNATASEIQSYVQNTGYPGIDPNNLTVTTTWYSPSASTPTTWTACALESGCNGPGDAVQVVVNYKFPLVILFLPSSSSPTLSGTAQMVIAQ